MIRTLSLAEGIAFVDGRKLEADSLADVVHPILQAVRREGDPARLRYARQFDGLGEQPVRVPEGELNAAFDAMSETVKQAVAAAVANIREYAKLQLPRGKFEELSPGRKLGWIVRPLD